MGNRSELPKALLDGFLEGMAIPAHPLALHASRQFDERHQRALTRYYVDSGADGVAVGVHSTQFEIRKPEVGLYRPVLALAAETARDWSVQRGRNRMFLVAGVCGETAQAVTEAEMAEELGYHAVLLSLSAIAKKTIAEKIEHCRRVADVMPLIGFYLQPAVGGSSLPYAFWREFAEIENVLGAKIAPFNRYQTLDVIRGIADSGNADRIAIYTGNDDNIVADLLTPYRVATPNGHCTVRMVGGLLGHWAVWTRKAVLLLEEIHTVIRNGGTVPTELLARGISITDTNAAFFDAANGFAGCIPGIHEVLRRQGLMESIACLNPHETLSPGQSDEIDRVLQTYPELSDDQFVREHLDRWLTA